MENAIKTKTKSARHTRDMTRGSIYKHMLSFALPILLSQLFQQLYNTADALIVGRFLGTKSLAAVSSSGPLVFLLISFFVGISMGAGVAISKYFGAGNMEKVSQAIHTNIAFGLVSGTLLTIVGVFFTPTLLVWMQTDPEVLPEAIEYFRFYFAGIITIVMYNMCKGIMNAVGDSRRPLYYLIVSSVLNVVLDVLFIGVFHWGVWAAAFATVLSQAFSFVLCLMHLLKKGNVFTITISKIRFHGDMLSEIVRYGLPSGIQNSVIALANVVVQSQINSFGTIATAAFGAHSKIEGFAFLPIMSFNMAISTFISQNLGAKKYDRAKVGARFGVLTAVALAQCIGFVVYALAPQFIAAFDDNPDVVSLGAMQARTLCLFYFLLSFSHSVAAVCRGAGKAFVPMSVMLSVWCVLRIIYIALVMRFAGDIRYIYWAYPITWAISSVIYFFYYIFSDWVHGFEHPKKNLFGRLKS